MTCSWSQSGRLLKTHPGISWTSDFWNLILVAFLSQKPETVSRYFACRNGIDTKSLYTFCPKICLELECIMRYYDTTCQFRLEGANLVPFNGWPRHGLIECCWLSCVELKPAIDTLYSTIIYCFAVPAVHPLQSQSNFRNPSYCVYFTIVNWGHANCAEKRNLMIYSARCGVIDSTVSAKVGITFGHSVSLPLHVANSMCFLIAPKDQQHRYERNQYEDQT